MNDNVYRTQNRIFNPNEQKTDIIIIGVGSTGSFIALTLAKMGFNKITIIDFDKVEEHNLNGQFYKFSDIGEFKVNALKEIIKDFTDIEINAINTKVGKNYNFEINLNSLIIIAVDDIKTRKLIYENVKEMPILLLDCRFGGEGFSIHLIDLINDEHKKRFEKSLDLPTKETTCGEKSIIYTILSLTSEVCNIIKKIEKGEETINILRRELKTYKFISGKW